MQSDIITIRNNPQIWRIAEWLHRNVTFSQYSVDWNWQHPVFKNLMYDRAKKLMYAFLYNEFIGEDDAD